MSRKIPPKLSVSITEEEQQLRRTDKGRLLFTVYKKCRCALYIQDNRLMAASFFPDRPSRIGAVYIGKIKSMVKNINACFVEIADGEICFLSLKSMLVPYLLNRTYNGRLIAGDEILVQVIKDSQGLKKACVTTQVSLYNDYFVLSVGSERASFSTKLNSERKKELKRFLTEKKVLKDGASELDMNIFRSLGGRGAEPENGALQENRNFMPNDLRLPPMGCVIRTKAGEESESGLLRQFFSLAEPLIRLLHTARFRNCFSCLKEAPEEFEAVFEQFPLMGITYNDTLRQQDSMSEETMSEKAMSKGTAESPMKQMVEGGWEIVTDQVSMQEPLERYCREHELDVVVRLYQDKVLPLSVLYSVESKLETALASRVWLKSGGYLIIEPTEALTVIDVNTGKYEAGKDPQETYRRINLEAAEEVAIQLVLRNLSGIIIVDFINMQSASYNRELLNHLKALVQKDKVQTHVVDMTPLGLVEITRKKISKPLREQFRSVHAE